jgi:hypothetical protein
MVITEFAARTTRGAELLPLGGAALAKPLSCISDGGGAAPAVWRVNCDG